MIWDTVFLETLVVIHWARMLCSYETQVPITVFTEAQFGHFTESFQTML